MKTKKHKKIIIILLLAALIGMYGFLPPTANVKAVDAIINASDTLSDSDNGVAATHTFNFTTGTTTPASGYWRIVYPKWFTNVGGGTETCAYGDANFAASTTGQIVDCTATADEAATTSQVVITSVYNPATTSSYVINIYNYDNNKVLLERVQVKVAIVPDVLMTATVDAILAFTISGLNSGSSVNGINCDKTTTATTTPFGTLVVNATSTVCQRLNVTTNADYGYTVTVWQDNELESDSGSNINSFDNSPNSTGSTTAHIWGSPDNTLDLYYTYGHMGLTSNDQDLNSLGGYNDFYNSGNTPNYAGLNDSDPMSIMHHNGPSDGSTQNIGQADVAYSIEIASLQEAGDYENTLTYVCTPTF